VVNSRQSTSDPCPSNGGAARVKATECHSLRGSLTTAADGHLGCNHGRAPSQPVCHIQLHRKSPRCWTFSNLARSAVHPHFTWVESECRALGMRCRPNSIVLEPADFRSNHGVVWTHSGCTVEKATRTVPTAGSDADGSEGHGLTTGAPRRRIFRPVVSKEMPMASAGRRQAGTFESSGRWSGESTATREAPSSPQAGGATSIRAFEKSFEGDTQPSWC
jgi:hypothetical protein